jgi:aspartate aminotransferase-like enzyme
MMAPGNSLEAGVNLRIPGPTPIPPEVQEALSRQMINHRGPEFADMLNRLTSGLQKIFQTKNDVLILTTSGTGVLEAAVVNTLSPGDKVLNVSIGAFGDRFGNIAETYGAKLVNMQVEWGQAADPAEIEKALAADPSIKAVLVTHNETSTGVTNDLEAIAKVVRGFDKLLLVDAISSLGAIPLPVDECDIDVAVTGSQKGFQVPPALAFVSVSERAWKASETAKMPRFYFDFKKAKDFAAKGQTPWTPAVSVCFALDVALGILLKEGLENIFARHHRIATKTRNEVKGLGLELFADPKHASDTITAVRVPEGVNGPTLNKIMREEHNTVLAGGQARLAGKIFRIGHLGLVSEADIDLTIKELRAALPKVGYKVPAAAS